MDQDVPQIRSLHRGLDVLDFLTEHGPSSLHQLHVGTGLSKSALRRILATLRERRAIRVGISDGMYRSNIATLRAVAPEDSVRMGRLVEAARPYMLELTERIKWPSDLHMYLNGRMRILESTHGMSPFGLPGNSVVEVDLNIFAAASGLAFLSGLGEATVRAIYEELKSDVGSSPERYALTVEQLLTELKAVRRDGYAKRRISQLGHDNQNAIAVMITEKKRPIGALSISWHRGVMSADDFSRTHLPAFKRCAEMISRALQ